jgi:hypothetical protein
MTLKEKFKKATSQWFDTTECEEITIQFLNEFIDSLDVNVIDKIRNSKGNAEVRRLLKSKINKS